MSGGNTIDIDDQEEFGIKKEELVTVRNNPISLKLEELEERVKDLEKNQKMPFGPDHMREIILDMKHRLDELTEWRIGVSKTAEKVAENMDLMLSPEDIKNAEKYLDKLRAAKQSNNETNL